MTIKELREKSVADVQKLVTDSREDLRKLRFAVKEGKEKNIRKLRDLTKTIARASTVLAEKERRDVPSANHKKPEQAK